MSGVLVSFSALPDSPVITYNLDGEHTILLTRETEFGFDNDPEVRAHVEAVAQTRANDTGHTCAVFRSNGSDLLLQKMPEKT